MKGISTVLAVILKVVYFLTLVGASMVLGLTVSDTLSGQYAAIAAVISVVVLALGLFILLIAKVSWRNQTSQDQKPVSVQTKGYKEKDSDNF